MPVIGFLDGQSFDLHLMTAFRQALKDAGYTEGRNVAIYFRSANGQTDRLVTLAGDIVGRRVAVIVTAGGGAAALGAYAATTTIPIVFVSGVDPVTSGLVMSLNRPGSNATGVYIFQQVLEGKRLAMLHGLVPAATLIAVLLNPTNANFQTQLRGVQDAARTLGQQVSILSASTERDIDVAFVTVTTSGAGALLAACAPAQSPTQATGATQAPQANPPAAGKKKLVFNSYTWSGYEAAMRSVIADWSKLHPDVEFEGQFVPQDDYWTKVQTMVASGTPPDAGEIDLLPGGAVPVEGVAVPAERRSAFSLINVDSTPAPAVLDQLRRLQHVRSVRSIEL